MSKNNYNRRNFFKLTGVGLLLGSAFLWDKLVRSERQLSNKRFVKIPFDPNRNISFHEDFIIINGKDQTMVYSSHCTHLGCSINYTKDDQLICPCHGSSFDKDGNPVKGPAVKALEKLQFKIDKDINQIIVEL